MKFTYKPGKGEKVHIYIDEKYYITTNIFLIKNIPFKNGCEISDEDLNNLELLIQENWFYEEGINFLSRRDYSKKELSDRILRKAYEKDSLGRKEIFKTSLENAVSKLEEKNILSEERFAKAYADELIRNKHLSKKGLILKLQSKGVRREISEKIVENMDINPEDEIYTLLKGKYKNRNLKDQKEKRRIYSALGRLGYSYGEIKSVYERVVLEENDQELDC